MRIFYFDLPPAVVAAGHSVNRQLAQNLYANFMQLAQRFFSRNPLTNRPECDILYIERKEREVLNYEEKRNNINNISNLTFRI